MTCDGITCDNKFHVTYQDDDYEFDVEFAVHKTRNPEHHEDNFYLEEVIESRMAKNGLAYITDYDELNENLQELLRFKIRDWILDNISYSDFCEDS